MSATTKETHAPRLGWRVVDIVVVAVLGVAIGVVFWGWNIVYAPISTVFAVFQPLQGLVGGVWLLGGTVGALVIRKPGAAFVCEVIAALVSMALGSQFGVLVLVSGILQGIGAELIFALTRYRIFTLWTAILSGLGAGLALSIGENIMYNNQWAIGWQLAYVVTASISGIVIAGIGGWLIVRALAETGVLSSFASGRSGREV